jgi:hypothetical protein
MQEITAPGANPLKKYFRQPKLYINLPSKGKFYPAGTLDMPETGELPVFPMTAKDEMTMKTPDALLNGQATVDVIASCVPNIKDPWKMPSIDLDAVLIAIRIATYGDKMDIGAKVPNVGTEKTFSADLNDILGDFAMGEFDSTFESNGLKVNIRPLTYQEFTKSSIKTFEEQRIFNLLNNNEVSEEEKLARFNESFQKLTTLTVETLTKGITSIEVEDQRVDNPQHILEFVENSEKKFFNDVLEHINKQREKFQVKPFVAQADEEEIAAGAPETYDIPITFDNSNFFA